MWLCFCLPGLEIFQAAMHRQERSPAEFIYPIINPCISEESAEKCQKLCEELNIDLVGRLFSMNMKMIDAYMGTGAICTVTAANTPGTIVNEIVCGEGKHPDNHAEHIRIGHPWGIMDAYADLQDNPDGTHTVLSGNLDRTARRIMEGYVYVRE